MSEFPFQGHFQYLNFDAVVRQRPPAFVIKYKRLQQAIATNPSRWACYNKQLLQGHPPFVICISDKYQGCDYLFRCRR